MEPTEQQLIEPIEKKKIDWTLIAIIITLIGISLASYYMYATIPRISTADLIKNGTFYCSQNNDTFEELVQRNTVDPVKYFRCNESLIRQDGSIMFDPRKK